MTQPKNSADFLLSFATGWPEDQPQLMILSLTTANGRKDYALTAEHAELISKTLKQTAAQLKKNKAVS